MNVFYENKPNELDFRDSRFFPCPLDCLPHLHYHIEMAVIFKGETTAVVDSVKYTAHKGDIIISFPNQVHIFEDSKDLEYALFIVNPDILEELSPLFASKLPESNLIKSSPSNKELFEITDRIADTYYKQFPYRSLVLKGYLTALFSLVVNRLELKDTKSGDGRVFGTILKYCINNSSENLSLSLLERELHISKYYISHVISQELKMGFNDYINSLRVSNACTYLSRSSLSITEISGAVGFNTIRTFNRAFRKQMGMSPADYRRTVKSGSVPLPSQMAQKIPGGIIDDDTN